MRWGRCKVMMNAYCCECKKEVKAEVVGGEIIYPHRPDLYDKDFAYVLIVVTTQASIKEKV